MRLARSASVEEREKKRRKFAMKRAETINFDNQGCNSTDILRTALTSALTLALTHQKIQP